MQATVELTRVELVGKPKDKGTAAEPNLWTLFFKYDGAVLRINSQLELSGAPEIKASVGTHKSLLEARVDRNGSIAIPADTPDGRPFGRYETSLVPFELPLEGSLPPAPNPPVPGPGPVPPLPDPPDPGDPLPDLPGGLLRRRQARPGRPRASASPAIAVPSPLAPAFGVIYVLLEWDLSEERTVESAHGAFNKRISTALRQVVVKVGAQGIALDNPSLSAEEQRALAKQVERDAIAAATATAKDSLDVGSAVDPDDFIGAAGHVYTPLDLVAPKSFTDRFDTTPTNDVGIWKVHGGARLT